MTPNKQKKKEKIPSQFNGLPSHSTAIKMLQFINLSKINCCGRAENRTRNPCVTDSCFTTKLLAHNNSNIKPNYLNLSL